eukprot:TRINITY_DN1165_c0_g1_i1.p1 TRINITY_DN1165_c0_g1~~TRINITY_DN1165_c0_g1_i1.p1  ORF type:complete len:204 (+),score=31.45 TRINITY_DN1165_c0_g1_i1:340-951(+)
MALYHGIQVPLPNDIPLLQSSSSINLMIKINNEYSYNQLSSKLYNIFLSSSNHSPLSIKLLSYEFNDILFKFQSNSSMNDYDKIFILKLMAGALPTLKRLHQSFPLTFHSPLCPLCGKVDHQAHFLSDCILPPLHSLIIPFKSITGVYLNIPSFLENLNNNQSIRLAWAGLFPQYIISTPRGRGRGRGMKKLKPSGKKENMMF